jgi:Uma2 family endonuclease
VEQWQPSAALVIEIISPGDKSREKLGFFAAHEVDEVVFVDPDKRTVEWLALVAGGAYDPLEHSSRLLDLGAVELASQLGWPTDQ